MQNPVSIRNGTAGDAAAAVATLARAFDVDPPLNWLIRNDERRVEALREFWDVGYRRLTLPHGCIDIADDFAGVAVWTPPGHWHVGPLTELLLAPAFIRILSLRRGLRGLKAINHLQRQHPRKPHYYLLGLGVDPPVQGRGIGAALLKSRLAICDAEGAPAYLEASTANSRALYERMGFETVEIIQMPPDAPPLWAMWREPRKG